MLASSYGKLPDVDSFKWYPSSFLLSFLPLEVYLLNSPISWNPGMLFAEITPLIFFFFTNSALECIKMGSDAIILD